ncbi:unnamed protein product [Rhizopus stolonifer]
MKTIYFVILLFACLTLTFGAWFETNGRLYQYFNIFNIELNNKLSNTPFITLSFGLWNHCAWNTTFLICSPIKINNSLDIDRTLQLVHIFNSSIAEPPTISESSSLIRFIPLLLASFVSVLAISISIYLLPKNTKRLVQQQALIWINSSLCLINILLITLAYAYTLDHYSSNITLLCSSLPYDCHTSAQVETILLGISIGLFALATLYPILFYPKSIRLLQAREGSRVSFYTEKSNEHPIEPLDFHDMYERTDRRPLSLRPPPPNHRQALEPPQLPFAKDERPLSHGSDNTFGAIRQNSLLLGDSDSSLMTDPRRNSQPLVDSANNSNHTLGTFCPKPSMDYYSSDDIVPEETFNQQNLHKRINNYLNSHMSSKSS